MTRPPNVRVSTSSRSTFSSRAGKKGVPPPRTTGLTNSRYSSIRPSSIRPAASPAPPTPRSFPGSLQRCDLHGCAVPDQASIAHYRLERPREHDLRQLLPDAGRVALRLPEQGVLLRR